MTLSERIKNDLNAALKSGAKEQAGVLRLLLAELHNKEKEKPVGSQVLNDEETLAVLQREAKKRKEAIELFRKGNREDLAQKDEAEIRVIGEYLPRALSAEEIKEVLDRLVAAGFKDFNSLMREAMKELKGKADGKTVGELVKEILPHEETEK
jgi:uncharacterized protein YqeY